MLKFKIKNTRTNYKVVPKGTKFRIKVQPDSRVTYDNCINNDLFAGEYNFSVNVVTANPGYDWDKPESTNTKDPDVVPGKV